MIDSLSLSPGNFLLDPRTNEWIEIDNVSANGFVDSMKGDFEGIYLNDLAPIVLTPEILERCGFEFEPVADPETTLINCSFKIENICLTWNAVTKTIWINNHNTEVAALHELQQLHYAINRKPLEISE